jgi:hypothetical protein
MLFRISWTVDTPNRVACWNAFGNMTPDDDLRDAGDKIKVLGRWHILDGGGGTCICECNDSAALNTWMLNWAPICNIDVVPVVDDAAARQSMVGKPWFKPKTS